MVCDQQGFQTTSELWTGSLFRERGVEAILGSHVSRVEEGVISYEILDGTTHTLAFDFAMLLSPCGGQPLLAYDREGVDITSEMFAPSGFMKVDAGYAPPPTPPPWQGWGPPCSRDPWGARPARALGQAHAPLPVPLQGQGPPGLAADSGVTMSETPDSTLADLSRSPMPTRRTLARRKNVVLQFFRFVSFDLRILRMVSKAHH